MGNLSSEIRETSGLGEGQVVAPGPAKRRKLALWADVWKIRPTRTAGTPLAYLHVVEAPMTKKKGGSKRAGSAAGDEHDFAAGASQRAMVGATGRSEK